LTGQLRRPPPWHWNHHSFLTGSIHA
jgi:hypothetical protein